MLLPSPSREGKEGKREKEEKKRKEARSEPGQTLMLQERLHKGPQREHQRGFVAAS
jgi:hypothetical protein